MSSHFNQRTKQKKKQTLELTFRTKFICVYHFLHVNKYISFSLKLFLLLLKSMNIHEMEWKLANISEKIICSIQPSFNANDFFSSYAKAKRIPFDSGSNFLLVSFNLDAICMSI